MVKEIFKNDSLKRTLLLSDHGIAYTEVENAIYVFVVDHKEHLYTFRYRKDTPVRFISNHVYLSVVSDELKEMGVSTAVAWKTIEEFDDTEIANKLMKMI